MYFRYHVKDTSPKTGQPVGLFVAVWRLVDREALTPSEADEYWKNRKYFEEALPVPPLYHDGNSIGAVTWFKDNDKTKKLIEEMEFYFRILSKYHVRLEIASSDDPGRIIYEDAYQVGVVMTADFERGS